MGAETPHFIRDYDTHRAALASQHPDDPNLAAAKLIGSKDLEGFLRQGDQQVEILKRFGLSNGDYIYDLGCGTGRTSQALKRANWHGWYKGADIQEEAVNWLQANCPGYPAKVWTDLSIDAPDESLDIIYAWSVFTHLMHEETFIYMGDAYRALKPGGRLIFSFLEFEVGSHWEVFFNTIEARRQSVPHHVNMFMHRDMIRPIADWFKFEQPEFITGSDESATTYGHFGQSIAAIRKP